MWGCILAQVTLLYDLLIFHVYWVQCCTFLCSRKTFSKSGRKKEQGQWYKWWGKGDHRSNWNLGWKLIVVIQQHQVTPRLLSIPTTLRKQLFSSQQRSHQRVSRASLVIRVHVKLCWSLSLLVHFFWKEGQRRRKGKKEKRKRDTSQVLFLGRPYLLRTCQALGYCQLFSL